MAQKEKSNIVGYLHSMETMGLVDGPGIRTIFFLQGCPLRCRYCHNPDTQKLDGGKEITPEDVLTYAKRYQPYQGEDGGVTFSGGEPLLQGKFLAAALKLLKENQISTCVDTSGFGQISAYPSIFPYVDTLLLDIKAFDNETFHEMCEVNQNPLLDFMNNLESYGFHGQIWIRHVMVPGFTDDEESMQRLIQTIQPIQHLVERLEILPYHTAGIQKYQELGRPYLLEGVPSMDTQRAKELEKYANKLLVKQVSQSRMHKSISYSSDAIESEPLMNVSQNNDNFSEKDIELLSNLGKLPLLKHLNPQVLNDMQNRLSILHLEKDDILFQSGDDPNYMYIICSGAIKIYTLLANNKEQILYIYRENDFVGGHNLLENKSYWYTGKAISETTIVAIPKIIFEAYLIEKKVVLKQILSQSFARIRWAEDLINRLAIVNSSVKTAGLLLRLAESIGEKNADETISIPLEIDRNELSNFSGLTRESLTRKLGEFEELGYIKIDHDKICILNQKALITYLD